MPVPAIPVLTAAARFVLSRGTREAVKKYGKVAVNKAKELIKKRDKAIERRAEERTKSERPFSSVTPEEVGLKRQPSNGALSSWTLKGLNGASELSKLKRGGEVRGAGAAIKGVRPCKMY